MKIKNVFIILLLNILQYAKSSENEFNEILKFASACHLASHFLPILTISCYRNISYIYHNYINIEQYIKDQEERLNNPDPKYPLTEKSKENIRKQIENLKKKLAQQKLKKEEELNNKKSKSTISEIVKPDITDKKENSFFFHKMARGLNKMEEIQRQNYEFLHSRIYGPPRYRHIKSNVLTEFIRDAAERCLSSLLNTETPSTQEDLDDRLDPF